MTTIEHISNVCHICQIPYTGDQVGSWSTALPKPNIKPLVCPNCGAPYKRGVNPHVGAAKDILLKLALDSKENAVNLLFKFSRTEADLEKWIGYVKNYATLENFKEWRNFESDNEKELNKISRIEELHSSGELVRLLDEVRVNVQVKINQELKKYQVQY